MTNLFKLIRPFCSHISQIGCIIPLFSTLFFALPLHASPAPGKIPAPQLPINSPGFNFKTTANFDDLRHNILELIGQGRKRVWLITDSLADGAIASALYTAKSRNQDVKVYLGRDQLNAAGSRLPYLRSQSIPAYLRPRTGYTAPTFLFVDQRLFAFTRDLNPNKASASTAEIIQASPAEVKAFVSWLKEVMVNPEIAYPRAFRGGRSAKEPFQGDSEGSYNYDRRGSSRKAPEGAARELPRVPKWKQTEELRRQGLQAPTAPQPVSPGSPAQETAPVPGSGTGTETEEDTKAEPSSAPEVEGMLKDPANPNPEQVVPTTPARPWNPPAEAIPAPVPPGPAGEAPPTTSP